MESSDVLARLEQSRRYEHEVGGVRFSMRLPTQEYLRRLYRQKTADGQPFDELDAQKQVVLDALVGWEGVTLGMITGEAGDGTEGEPVPFSRDTAAAWFEDTGLTLRDELVIDIWRRVGERHQRREEDEKN